MLKHPTNKKNLKRFFLIGGTLLLIGAGIYIYNILKNHEDTANVKTDFTVEAIPFIKEFENNVAQANAKYAEKIIAVTGTVTATEAADTTINIKMEDSSSGSYLIFAFQKQHLDEARLLKPQDIVTIKGSCSDGIYSQILGTYFVSFKRSTLVN
jgi:hypothetical protein